MLSLISLPIRRVEIDPVLVRKLWSITIACPIEVSGIGTVTIADYTARITEPFHLLKQKNSSALTELDMNALAELIEEYTQTGRATTGLKFWWHSHVHMPAFFSGTDTATILRLRDWMDPVIAGVFNKRGDSEWRVQPTTGKPVDWEWTIPGAVPSQAEIRAVQPEVDRKVEERSYFDRTKDYIRGFGFYGGTGAGMGSEMFDDDDFPNKDLVDWDREDAARGGSVEKARPKKGESQMVWDPRRNKMVPKEKP